jgi:hypothetical protein
MWNYEGLSITGTYLGDHFIKGYVILSRVAYGGRVVHTVVLDEPIQVYGTERDRVILDMSEILTVKDQGELLPAA